MANSLLRSILGTVQREVDRALRRQVRAGRRSKPGPTRRSRAPEPAPGPPGGYPGDFRVEAEIQYAPHPDGEPDPGEIVWAWVPYEEDHSQGKDRPVLLIGHDGPWLLALQMTSRDHDRDEEQERRAGRIWVDIGSGAWDRQGRPSEVRVNRILRIDPDRIRREGAVLARDRFDAVAAGVLQHT